ncbi:MAG: hypothetical protein ACFB4J_00545 [Elainellaceae cyanobacterium]
MISNFCSTLLCRIFLSDQQTRRALRWWHQRQVDRLHDGAELIRDGILQDLFAIRRGLELACDDDLPQDSLQQLEALHLRLEAVSNKLSPAFFRDSLPLAIQHLLQDWQQRYPNVRLTTQLPQVDPSQVLASASQVAFLTLEELLILISDRLQADTVVMIDLQQGESAAALTLKVTALEPSQCCAIAHLEALLHLRQTFEVLTGGTAIQDVTESEMSWKMSWPLLNPSYPSAQDNQHHESHNAICD